MEGVGVRVGVRASIHIIVHLSYDGGGGSNSGGCGGRMSKQMHTSRAKMSIALYKCSSHKSWNIVGKCTQATFKSEHQLEFAKHAQG